MHELIWKKNIPYDERYAACVLDVCEPADVEKAPLFIFFHGGGLEVGTQEITPALRSLAEDDGIAVVSVAYRMYPEAKFPDYLVDSANAIAWLCREWNIAEKYSKIVVGGSSAGGYISQMLCFAGHYLRDAGVDASIIDGWFLDAGQPTTHFKVLAERGLDSRLVRIDDAAPLWYLNESFQGKHTVPILILSADQDMVNRLEQNMVLATALKHLDYPAKQVELRVMKGYRHCQYDRTQDADGRYTFEKVISAFILDRVGG